MLHLNRASLKNVLEWQRAGFTLPLFNVEQMIAKTKEHPTWVHFGAGNIFRSFIAPLQQELLNKSRVDTGIIAVSTYDAEIIDKVYTPYENLGLLVLMHPDGHLEKTVVASVAEGLVANAERRADWARVKQIFQEPSLQVVSFTITEKGYSLTDFSGELHPEVKEDLAHGPNRPKHFISKITALCYGRYLAGEWPLAFVSMDNCSQNGELLRNAIYTVARGWSKREFIDPMFLGYLNNPSKVSFPWSMIDKITPRPSEFVREALRKEGVADLEIYCTRKKTFIAPFVNAEVPQYLVIEDHFPNGRMPLDEVGVIFTRRETVEKVERMKVTTCLNPLHTALAVFGCLLDYSSIAEEMKDPVLKELVKRIGYDEGLPVAVDSGVLNPREFMTEVIEERLPNPYIPDTPQRIATDTSQKMAIRFGETIKAHLTRPNLDVTRLQYIPLVIAGWCRYLLGVNDDGKLMTPSFDPMQVELTSYLTGIELGNLNSYRDNLRPILSNEKLFGVNLYEVGLGLKIEGYFKEMILGRQAVRNTLSAYLA